MRQHIENIIFGTICLGMLVGLAVWIFIEWTN